MIDLKSYIKEIINIIENKLSMSQDKNSFFRLDHFIHPKIYLDVCLHFRNFAIQRNIKFTAKMAKEKYEFFGEVGLYRDILEQLKDYNFVCVDEQLTKWRNTFAEEKGIVILMGTESVQDKGGLVDFYSITPNSVEISLGQNYHKWFGKFIDINDELQRNLINNFFKHIFKHVPIDLFKLSVIVDDLETEEIIHPEDVINFIGAKLWDYFRLPNIKKIDKLFITKLRNNKRIDIIDKAVKFINRTEYKDSLSEDKFRKLEVKFTEFEKKNPQLITDFQQEILKEFESFRDLKEAIINFNKGKNIEILRPKLSKLDFNLINAILDLRITKGDKSKKEKITNIYGSPLQAYTKVLLDSIKTYKQEFDLKVVDKLDIEIKVKEITITDTINDDENKFDKWHDMCIALGGIVDYLGEELDENVQLNYVDNKDPFTLDNFSNINLKADSATEKLSKIHFEINIDGKLKKEYKWVYNPYEYWLQSFSFIKTLKDVVTREDRFLPIFYTKGIGTLLTSTDRDSFHFQLKSHEIKYVNIFSSFPNGMQSSFLVTRLYQLVEPFNKFIKSISENGLYNTINTSKDNSGIIFISKYVDVIESITKKIGDLSDSEKDFLNLVVNQFLIVSSKDVAEKQLKLKGAIVPPYHPAMLEKIVDQQAFQRKGLVEMINLVMESDQLKQNYISNKLERLEKQSMIISGVDTILCEDIFGRIPSEVYGYYALHGTEDTENFLDTSTILDIGLIFDEDFNNKELLSNTPTSQIITNHIRQYVNTFPSNTDTLSICFINFEQLQTVVAGLHNFIEQYKDLSHCINLKLHVLSPSKNQQGRKYIHLWLDNFFSEEDNVNIETYYNDFDFEKNSLSELKRLLNNYDIAFFENILETSSIDYERTGEKSIKPSDTRFPMVFHPMPAPKKDRSRNISISQKQFKASFTHSQLVFWIERPYSEKELYRVEKKLVLTDSAKVFLDYLHEKARWVITIDTGLDKTFYENEKIISFSTGEGPFGELNVAISSSPEVRKDISARLKSRLQAIFTSWSSDLCIKSANYCIEKSSILDGIKILKALNPHNYEIHNFLSSLLSVETLDIQSINDETIIKSYIPLDSYQHWFYEEQNRPDFLLLEIDKEGLYSDILKFKATLVECKMGKESDFHVEKGKRQLQKGLKFLTSIFNPSSNQYDRRYWYAQLYRLLAFSPIFITRDESERDKLNQNLLKILNGNFEIQWDSVLLTYWLDYNQEVILEENFELEEVNISCCHKAFGQIYIQKQLLPKDSQSNISFVDPLSSEIKIFADDPNDYKDILKEINVEDIIKKDYSQETNENIEDVHRKINGNGENGSSGLNRIESKPEVLSSENESKININSEYEHVKYFINQENSLNNLEVADPPLLQEKNDLSSIRILLGEEIRTKKKIYWEYGHPQLENRHILISGKSGVGKTYFIQCLLLELARNNISSIIFDYTDGFKKSKLEPEFKEFLGDRIKQFHVQLKGFPINPFKKNMKEIDEGIYKEEENADVAERIRSVFSAVYKGMGDQQANAIYRATMRGLEKYGSKMNLQYLRTELEADGSSYAKTVLAKIEPLIDRNPFDSDSEYNWAEHRKHEGIVFVVQLSGFVREVQLIVTEFILWDLWNFNLSHGDKTKPFPVILDEAQNLDHSESSPSAKILTEGRKFGWSGWYATQFMQGQLSKDEIQRLQNASQKVYFSPPETEINDIASFLSMDNQKKKEWAMKLANLGKGQCIVSGPILKPDGSLERLSPMIINVTPLSERINKL